MQNPPPPKNPWQTIKQDIDFVIANDPAAKCKWLVAVFYAGLHAVWLYRIGHHIYTNGLFGIKPLSWLGYVFTGFGRFLTGIEIHPAATIGRCLFLDHGMGIVIGETTVIGDYVTLYHSVTLGGTGKAMACGRRHPKIGNRVIIGAGAQVLGAVTVGDHVLIGSNAVVLEDISSCSTAVGVPARIIPRKPLDNPEADCFHPYGVE